MPSEVAKREDMWIDIPSHTPDGFTADPIQLRPGADESMVRVSLGAAYLPEVRLEDLRDGLKLVEEEHAR